MTKLKLGPFVDDRPVKLSIELPASVYRDLVAYGVQLARTAGATKPIEPAKLIAPMLERFMATDRVFEGAAAGVIDFPGDFAPSDFLRASARRFSNAWLRLCGDQRALKVIGSGSSRMGRNTTPGKDTCAAASLVNAMP